MRYYYSEINFIAFVEYKFGRYLGLKTGTTMCVYDYAM